MKSVTLDLFRLEYLSPHPLSPIVWAAFKPERQFTPLQTAVAKQLEQRWWRHRGLTVSATSMSLDDGRPSLTIVASYKDGRAVGRSTRGLIEKSFSVFDHAAELYIYRMPSWRRVDKIWSLISATTVGITFVAGESPVKGALN